MVSQSQYCPSRKELMAGVPPRGVLRDLVGPQTGAIRAPTQQIIRCQIGLGFKPRAPSSRLSHCNGPVPTLCLRWTHREHSLPSGRKWYCKTGEQNFNRTIYTVDVGHYDLIMTFLIYFRFKDVSDYSFWQILEMELTECSKSPLRAVLEMSTWESLWENMQW